MNPHSPIKTRNQGKAAAQAQRRADPVPRSLEQSADTERRGLARRADLARRSLDQSVDSERRALAGLLISLVTTITFCLVKKYISSNMS